MDSPGEEIDRELDEYLRKEAAAAGIDYEQRSQQELELWRQWKAAPSPEVFGQLHASHQSVINYAGRKYLSSTVLPKAAVRSDMLKNYIQALDTYDPARGAALNTHITNSMRRTGRYLNTYSNTGKIPEKRGRDINLFQNRYAHLKELLGREPTNTELADDMMLNMDEAAKGTRAAITPREAGLLKKELRRDLMAESAGPGIGVVGFEDSAKRDRLIFLHGSLNPEQQLVLEHSFPDWGKRVIEDPIEMAKELNMSPQKVRAIRKQFYDRLEKRR